MRYGREYAPIDPASVETPEVNVNTFISIFDNLLYGKYPDGSIKLLSAGGSTLLAAQAVNAGTADDVVVDIDGVVAYNNGDTYFIYMTEANTGAMTIDVSGVGSVNIVYAGSAAQAMPAGTIEANTVNVFIYNGTNFEWIGKVDGDKVRFEISLDYLAYQAIGGSASEDLDIAFPASAGVDKLILTADAADEYAGGAATAAEITVTDVTSGADYFGGAANVFTGATAAGEGGWSDGEGKIAGVVPNLSSRQTKRFNLAITGDTIANLTQGSAEIHMTWELYPW